MLFRIILAAGSETVSTMQSFVHDNNDFRTAAMMGTAALFSNEGVDNVTLYRCSDDGKTISSDHFFYGEKE